VGEQMDYRNIFKELEKMRKESLFSGKRAEWVVLTDYLGMNPEDKELYDQGIQELAIDSSIRKRIEKSIDALVEKKSYIPSHSYKSKSPTIKEIKKITPGETFLTKYENSNLDHNNIRSDISQKEELLLTFGKYQEGGPQDLRKYTPTQVGYIFKRLVESYQKKFKK
jgi:hypothetical protein